jgi:hypothetical protein
MVSRLISNLERDERFQAVFVLIALAIAVAVGLLTASIGWGSTAFMALFLVLVQFRNRRRTH